MENQAKARFIQRGQFHWSLKESPQGRQAIISATAQWKRSGEGKQPGSLVNAVRSGQALSGDRTKCRENVRNPKYQKRHIWIWRAVGKKKKKLKWLHF